MAVPVPRHLLTALARASAPPNPFLTVIETVDHSAFGASGPGAGARKQRAGLG